MKFPYSEISVCLKFRPTTFSSDENSSWWSFHSANFSGEMPALKLPGTCVPSVQRPSRWRWVLWKWYCSAARWREYGFAQLRILCHVWLSWAESHLAQASGRSLIWHKDSIVCSAERLCEDELCCLGHRIKVSGLCFLYKSYHRINHSMNENLNHLVAARNTRASAALRLVFGDPVLQN